MIRVGTAVLFLGCALVVGCDDKTDSPPPTPPVAPKVSTDKPSNDLTQPGVLDTMKSKAAEGEAALNAARTDATTRPTQLPSVPTDAMKQAQSTGANGAASAKDSVVAQAQQYYDQAKQMITARNFNGAQDMLGKLEGLQSQLPAEWQTKITELKSMLTQAKGAMPGGF